jgi:hypothetical protein
MSKYSKCRQLCSINFGAWIRLSIRNGRKKVYVCDGLKIAAEISMCREGYDPRARNRLLEFLDVEIWPW